MPGRLVEDDEGGVFEEDAKVAVASTARACASRFPGDPSTLGRRRRRTRRDDASAGAASVSFRKILPRSSAGPTLLRDPSRSGSGQELVEPAPGVCVGDDPLRSLFEVARQKIISESLIPDS